MALLTQAPEGPPLDTDEQGVVRVAGTRVTLDSVLIGFRNGETAEEIALAFPVLSLADVYATITYYLRHREDVDAYLAEQEEAAAEAKDEAERYFDTSALRSRLLARRSAG
jgi:uncharacterized protein (DUF433 family)